MVVIVVVTLCCHTVEAHVAKDNQISTDFFVCFVFWSNLCFTQTFILVRFKLFSCGAQLISVQEVTAASQNCARAY